MFGRPNVRSTVPPSPADGAPAGRLADRPNLAARRAGELRWPWSAEPGVAGLPNVAPRSLHGGSEHTRAPGLARGYRAGEAGSAGRRGGAASGVPGVCRSGRACRARRRASGAGEVRARCGLARSGGERSRSWRSARGRRRPREERAGGRAADHGRRGGLAGELQAGWPDGGTTCRHDPPPQPFAAGATGPPPRTRERAVERGVCRGAAPSCRR